MSAKYCEAGVFRMAAISGRLTSTAANARSIAAFALASLGRALALSRFRAHLRHARERRDVENAAVDVGVDGGRRLLGALGQLQTERVDQVRPAMRQDEERADTDSRQRDDEQGREDTIVDPVEPMRHDALPAVNTTEDGCERTDPRLAGDYRNPVSTSLPRVSRARVPRHHHQRDSSAQKYIEAKTAVASGDGWPQAAIRRNQSQPHSPGTSHQSLADGRRHGRWWPMVAATGQSAIQR